MSDAEGEDAVPRFESNWLHTTTRNATERHLGRTLRAMYDAMPSVPPSEDLCALLRRADAPPGDDVQ